MSSSRTSSRRLAGVFVVALGLVMGATSGGASAASQADQPLVDHVFVYIMENTNYGDVVGNPDAPYLNSLVDQFQLATNYYATGHASLDNYIAMTSGQLPNPATSGDCFVYFSVVCILDVDNIADQLEAGGWSWKGYMDNMPGTCVHTEENTLETSQTGYSTRHNPFMYYRSIVDDQARCDVHDVPMDELWVDLAAGTVPNYSFLTPDSCHDGHDSGAACEKGGGVVEADWFASITLPRILEDPIFERSMVFVTFDENGFVDDEAVPFTYASGTPDFGGRVFMVVASPRVEPGSTTNDAYDHFSQLKTVEDIFCLDHLAGAAGDGVASMISLIGQERCAIEPTAASSGQVADPQTSEAGAPSQEAPESLPVTGGGSRWMTFALLGLGGLVALSSGRRRDSLG